MGLGVSSSGVWIYQATDPNYRTYVHLPKANYGLLQGQQYGRVEPFMGGTLRHIKGPTRSRTIEVQAPSVPRFDAERLDGWAGDYLIYRDAFGRAMWGTFLRFSIVEGTRFADGSVVSTVRFTFLGTSRTASELTRFKEEYPDVIYPASGYGLEELQ